MLRQRGGITAYSDPHVPTFHGHGIYDFVMESVALIPQTLAEYDAVVLATDHDRFDYDMIADNARLIVDSRGRYRREMASLIKA